MRKYIILCILVATAMCREKSAVEEQVQKGAGLAFILNQSESEAGPMSYEEFLSRLTREEDGPYIIDYDVTVYEEKHLRELYAKKILGEGEIASSTQGLAVDRLDGADNIWSPDMQKKITYCVSNAFGSKKAQVIATLKAAAEEWEAVANVDFTHKIDQDQDCRAGNHNVVFDVRPVTSGRYLARAFFPNDARRYRNLMIDNTAFIEDEFSTLRGTLLHELGHTLGFRHEHTRPEAQACFEDSAWRGVTTYDAYSVMHYPQCNGRGTNLVLTQKDKDGARILYGAPGATMPAMVTESFMDRLTKGYRKYYGPFAVVAGTTATVELSGDGDGDLYVRNYSKPTTATYNCRPYIDGSEETCALSVQDPFYVMVLAGAITNYQIKVTYAKK